MVWVRDKLSAVPELYAGQLSDSGNITLVDALYSIAAGRTMPKSILFLLWDTMHYFVTLVGFIGEKKLFRHFLDFMHYRIKGLFEL